ncbi:MAG: bifunctional shikimate kinase/3-dehydroquinate synthase [Streptosporangiaceae bacterium]|jgi:shikimate kinase/3-dehydroquinate synthase
MIVLVGFMGAGKTTVGHLLADKLGLPFTDSDLVIEQRERRSVRDIFAADGEPAFRQLEHQVVGSLLDGPDAVLALGGGAAEHPATRELLKSASVVYLRVGYDEAMLRIAGDTYRPLLARPGLKELYARRLAVYESVASLMVATDGRRPEAISLDILSRLVAVSGAPAGTTTVLVSCVGGTYNAHVGTDLLEATGRLLPSLPYARTAVVLAAGSAGAAAETVARALGDSGLEPRVLTVPDSQAAKSLGTVSELADALADLAVHKNDLIVGVGGEVTCDLAGFLAATYNRGMPLALVPTTLAAQADASVGGKASLNLPLGRNLLGLMHQPVAVISDVPVAAAASAEYGAGLAEIVKHALISGDGLVDLLRSRAGQLRERDFPALTEAVAGSVAVKASIVSGDEREQGDRLFLNYGHTFGHAFEQVSGPDRMDDGQAVALGMMAAAYLAFRQGRIDAELVNLHRELLSSVGLPVSGSFDLATLRDAWQRDKKYRSGTRFVVLNGLGKPQAGVPADEETLAGVLADLARGEPR